MTAMTAATAADTGIPGADPAAAVHWFDFLCPFCYVDQARDAILARHGLPVVDQPMRAHPEIPPDGRSIGPRNGPMYAFLEAEAARAGLLLRWPARLPDTRIALGAAEWVRVHHPSAAHALNAFLFAAHFAREEDIGDVQVVERYAAEAGVAVEELRHAIANGATDELLLRSERHARRSGVSGTPAWLIRGQLVSGLQPAEVFERLAAS